MAKQRFAVLKTTAFKVQNFSVKWDEVFTTPDRTIEDWVNLLMMTFQCFT